MAEAAAATQQFYITTRSSPPDERARVLKYGKTFATFNRYGDIIPEGLGEEGIFHRGTRHLSMFEMCLGGTEPLLLSSTISADNFLFTADLSNVDLTESGEINIQRGTVHLARTKFLWDGVCFERFRFTNYGLQRVTLPLRFRMEADFADIFEVRGTQRERRGRKLPEEVGPDWVVHGYEGRDGILRHTRLEFEPQPRRCSASEVLYQISLDPKEEASVTVRISAESALDGGEIRAAPEPFDVEFNRARRLIQQEHVDHCRIYSSNEQFNNWFARSVSDLEMMIRGNPEKHYPYAGVPWYSTVFGRDGLIAALQSLWLWPDLGRGVLQLLASLQAQTDDPDRDAEPGKILHELRGGEMANLKEVPFGRYYGSVDSTPLFLMLASAYLERTGDLDFITSLWPNLQAALGWISDYGDLDGDGFVEYLRRSPNGLTQQGWKDSTDSVFHADGKLAEGPIALCEVQGYVYAAKVGMAKVAAAMGDDRMAQDLQRQAEHLQRQFEEAFWCEDIGIYAIALDGKKRPCRVRTSNAGHCLYTGIAHQENARIVGQTLLGPDFFSGWGVRTVGAREIRYNPISYHNGSVWPHDNALIASGLARYGIKEMAGRIFTSLLDVSVAVELHRLPELFCGLHRRSDEGPTLYPVACSPQAWSAASVFMLLQSFLGIRVDGGRRVVLERPYLPDQLRQLWIKNLKLANGRVDLLCERMDKGVHVEVLDNPDGVEVITE